MEALACQEIFNRVEREELQLVWSFMHKDETILCPFPERKIEAFRLSNLCEIKAGPNEETYNYARSFQSKARRSAKDAIHLACALYTRAGFFISCDDEAIKRAMRLSINIKLMNPVDYIQKEMK